MTSFTEIKLYVKNVYCKFQMKNMPYMLIGPKENSRFNV